MRYYIDTEFIEYPCTIDLISIGIKCEDGRTFYAISTAFDSSKASDWVKENVISKLDEPGHISNWMSLGQIKNEILNFIGDDKPEFYGYYADYDWVVFCWLFGSMSCLPNGWPMYCKDLKQIMDERKIETMPINLGEHNALSDAVWTEELHKYILEY